MMATVNFACRFLDVQISHPGATSDYLAFATSDLKAKIERPGGGFLAPGLVIFGDNAYSNNYYMHGYTFQGYGYRGPGFVQLFPFPASYPSGMCLWSACSSLGYFATSTFANTWDTEKL
jgi:hypothetical protein